MGNGGDALTSLVERHVSAGLGIPYDVEETLRLRITEGCTDQIDDDAWRWFCYQFLRVAVGLMRGGDRSFAWSLVEAWERGGWSDRQAEFAWKMLETAYACAAGVRAV